MNKLLILLLLSILATIISAARPRFGHDSSLFRALSIRGGAVSHPNDAGSFNKILNSSGEDLVVVDFSATWCGPCKMIAPVFEEMSNEFGGVVFVKIDVDEVPEIAQKYQVMAMPTFLFLRKGEIVGRFSGASGDKLREMLASLM